MRAAPPLPLEPWEALSMRSAASQLVAEWRNMFEHAIQYITLHCDWSLLPACQAYDTGLAMHSYECGYAPVTALGIYYFLAKKTLILAKYELKSFVYWFWS